MGRGGARGRRSRGRATTIDLDALAAYADEHLAGYKRPRTWEVRDELPRTESGKLLKRVLRDEHWQGAREGLTEGTPSVPSIP